MNNGAMKALIIDDEPAIRDALAQTLRSARIETVLAEDGEIGLTALDARSDVGVVFLDIKMPGKDGMEVLSELRRNDKPGAARDHDLGARDHQHGGRRRHKQGAFDFLEKPPDRDRILLRESPQRPRPGPGSSPREHQRLKGARRGAHPRQRRQNVKELIDSPSTGSRRRHARVLITGENGTGKELVARRLTRPQPPLRTARSWT